ncbi:hypothetical protein [Sphingobium sp. KCTC 72723]|uniref:hypothetical protein n=1 Tax=Sphingobium sp. KCTC 72723 TaxID=2733867 RepID=UPI00165E9BDD|nr:hypothetical protein [Sphingobium sp. KCTC 72723]
MNDWDSDKMARRTLLGLFANGTATLLAGCGSIFPSDRLRQKITVEVETPSGLGTGSSVVETEVHKGKSWGDVSGIQYKLGGEAVAVDLPDGRTLFALLRGADGAAGDAAAYQVHLIPDALRAGAVANANIVVEGRDLMTVREKAKRARVRLDLPPKFYPLLVAFRDIKDATSVERVDPVNLAVTFGPGVKLKRISVEITDVAVTTGIEKRLPKPPYIRKFRYEGEESKALDLYRGKPIFENVDKDYFIQMSNI